MTMPTISSIRRPNRTAVGRASGATTWRTRLAIAPPRLLDVATAIATAVATTVAISVAVPLYPESRPADALAYALGITFGALVLVARRWPVGVLIASFILLQVYYWSNYPTIWPAVPLAAALYTAAATGHLRWSLAVAGWYWAIPLALVLLGVGVRPLAAALNDLVRDGSLMVAALLAGDAARSHGALMAEAAARLRRAKEDRERETRELSAARVIQQQLLPKDQPAVPGWRIAAHYQPARAVGGDFYDVFDLPAGQVALVAGDVSDKGIPAALVMATTHSILRSDAPDLMSPGPVLAHANDRLYASIPPLMFVTCLYIRFDPVSGHVRYANAGHNLPYLATAHGARELRATGMPLGAMPGTVYDEHETELAPGDCLLLYSDGLVEAHNAAGEMFGFPRLKRVVAQSRGNHLIDACLAELRAFVGDDWDQEDDITLVTLQRDARISSGGAGVPAGR